MTNRQRPSSSDIMAYPGDYEGSDVDQCKEWIEDVLDTPLDEEALSDLLRSGVLLCEFANRLSPGAVKKVSASAMPFPQRENINAFISAARTFGVPDRENFDTSDLFEQSNMKQVMICLRSLGRAAYHIPGYEGPCWGKVDGSGSPAKPDEVKTDGGLWGKSGGDFGDVGGGVQVEATSRGTVAAAPAPATRPPPRRKPAAAPASPTVGLDDAADEANDAREARAAQLAASDALEGRGADPGSTPRPPVIKKKGPPAFPKKTLAAVGSPEKKGPPVPRAAAPAEPLHVYRSLKRAVMREGYEMDSDKAGVLEKHQIVRALEARRNQNGVLRVRVAGGWVSSTLSDGKTVLEPVSDAEATAVEEAAQAAAETAAEAAVVVAAKAAAPAAAPAPAASKPAARASLLDQRSPFDVDDDSDSDDDEPSLTPRPAGGGGGGSSGSFGMSRMSNYICVKKTVIRSGFDMDSDKAGVLSIGSVITPQRKQVNDDGITCENDEFCVKNGELCIKITQKRGIMYQKRGILYLNDDLLQTRQVLGRLGQHGGERSQCHPGDVRPAAEAGYHRREQQV